MQKTVEFYSTVFNWKFTRDESIPIEYWRISAHGMNGGLLKRPAKVPLPAHGTNAYVCSIEVENFDETAKKILDNSGIVALPKFAVPGRCWQGSKILRGIPSVCFRSMKTPRRESSTFFNFNQKKSPLYKIKLFFEKI